MRLLRNLDIKMMREQPQSYRSRCGPTRCRIHSTSRKRVMLLSGIKTLQMLFSGECLSLSRVGQWFHQLFMQGEVCVT
ncbi:unnamed protein product [Brassica rapa subsp. trilocularis]